MSSVPVAASARLPGIHEPHPLPEVQHGLETASEFRSLWVHIRPSVCHTQYFVAASPFRSISPTEIIPLPPVYFSGLCNARINHIILMVRTNSIRRSKPSILLVSTQLEK